MWDLVSWPGIWHGPSALGEQSLSHWITKRVLFFFFFGSPGFSRQSVPNTWLLGWRAILDLRSWSSEWCRAASSCCRTSSGGFGVECYWQGVLTCTSSRAAFSWVTWQWFPRLGTSRRIAFPSTSGGQISSKSCQRATSATSHSLSSSQTLLRGVCVSAGFGERSFSEPRLCRGHRGGSCLCYPCILWCFL